MESRKKKHEHILSYEKILCEEELFKHRKPYDKTVPQRGGDKDFSPDDSWVQAKRLEKFYEERKTVLAEPRVERVGSLVTGEWNPDIQLVELHKEMGKFWSTMGFTDKSKKWLYPEEALFLMETNTLEVWYKGLPVSIQQAYTEFLKNLKFEEYQVYAHLRRIGYVVLRHNGRLLSTKYERMIKLDKHINLKKRKMKMKQQSVFVENVQQDSTPQKKVRLENSTDSVENCPVEMQVDTDTVSTCGLSRENGKSCSQGSYQLSQRDRLNKDECFRTICKESWNENGGKINQSEDIHFSRNKEKNVERKTDSEYLNEGENSIQTKYSEWNFEVIRFPDIGVPGDIQLKGGISQKYLPKGIPPLSCEKIDKEQLKQKQKSQRRKETEIRYGQDLDTMDLNFSCDVSQPVKKVSASNWKEYKERLMESLEHSSFKSPVKHFWTDGVVPLIRPEEAINTFSVLKKLQVIPQWEGNSGVMSITDTKKDSPKVSYDVYKPDAKFRKSSPGVPDHRVCIVRSEEDPPSLSSITSLYSYYDDEVPLHWAVVDDGEIAFYSFDNVSFPTQIFMG